ncbi:hypothetical protein GIB67_005734 [Kingdonia uniflora]|uniref:Small ribosomal subunit protein uS5 n=1 Tax=Kingdonia uniflora TaxID=39325 RepID=A0A7J7KVK6_9MAGN|nr:hypothetical protein GIB67_005734 [Kingdonia uniflora]
MPVQKQTRAGQRTRFKAFVVIGDNNGHLGLGVKCSKEVATAIRGSIILAKLSVIPVRRRVPKKVLQFAGIEDVFISSRGSTKTLGNFFKATFDCLHKTYGFLTLDFWWETRFNKSPFQEWTDILKAPTTKTALVIEPVEKQEA